MMFHEENFNTAVYERVQSLYMNKGYIYSRIDPLITAVGKDSLDVHFRITENHKVFVRSILIGGNTKTRENVIRRELRIFPGDVRDLLPALPRACISKLFVLFPDPWPKKRHQKRRLIQTSFLDLLASRLKRAGRVYFATDDVSYAECVLEIVDRSEKWINLSGQRCYAPRPHFRSVTRFEKRADDDHRRVYDLIISPASG